MYLARKTSVQIDQPALSRLWVVHLLKITTAYMVEGLSAVQIWTVWNKKLKMTDNANAWFWNDSDSVTNYYKCMYGFTVVRVGGFPSFWK